MNIKNFLKPVLPQFPELQPGTDIEVLQELPVETLYLALKKADAEMTQWFLENAQPHQVQGLVDIDCWKGSRFLPERSTLFFQDIALLEPPKLFEYMKGLDPEIVVRTLLEHCQVLDYDVTEPLDLPEKAYLLSPDNKYVLILKTESPQIREALYQWLNKISATSLDLMRRHLESCKWEQISDLEEFSYQVKKGRLEDMGFVDYHEAIKLYAVGEARTVKEELIKNPISKASKKRVQSVEEVDESGEAQTPEEWWPAMMSDSIHSDGFLAKALAEISDAGTRQVVSQEVLRTLNACLAADDSLHKDLEDIQKVLARGRLYLDLGLTYMAQGQSEEGAHWLETQPLMEIYRLGWLVVQDLQKGARGLLAKSPLSFFGTPDADILQGLTGRHPNLDATLLKDMNLNADNWLNLEGILKIGERLAQLAWVQKFFLEDLQSLMNFDSRPLLPNESAYARLATAIFRQNTAATGSEEGVNSSPLKEHEWLERAPLFNKESFSKALGLIVEQAPAAAKALLLKRLDSLADDLEYFSKNSSKKLPDLRFFKSLVFDLESMKQE